MKRRWTVEFAEKVRAEPFLICLLVLMLGCSKQPVVSFSPPQKNAQPANSPNVASSSNFADFRVDLSLSKRAEQSLNENKESVVVVAEFTGKPKKGALKSYVNDLGEIELGWAKLEVAPGENAMFKNIALKADALEQTDNGDPQVLVNVFSGRKSSKDNMLICGIYQGGLRHIQGGNVAIPCSLIGE